MFRKFVVVSVGNKLDVLINFGKKYGFQNVVIFFSNLVKDQIVYNKRSTSTRKTDRGNDLH